MGMTKSSDEEVVSAVVDLIAAHDEADLGSAQNHLRDVLSRADFPECGWPEKIRQLFVGKELYRGDVGGKIEVLKERFAF